MSNLPAVGGRTLGCSINEFEHRARVYLSIEQAKISPDNALIAFLCDSVRLAREYGDSMQVLKIVPMKKEDCKHRNKESCKSDIGLCIDICEWME